MNYQFTRNHLGQPVAKFDMGAEVLARWLTEELGERLDKIAEVLNCIEQLEHKKNGEIDLHSKEFIVRLDPYEVDIRSTMDGADGVEDLPEGTELYEQESRAGCGLDDFKQVLISWHGFVSNA